MSGRKASSNFFLYFLITTSSVFVLADELRRPNQPTDMTIPSNVSANTREEQELMEPTVLIAILVRNKAHALPYFFGALERLNYPKQRIALWIRSDHNIDNSTAIIQRWLSFMEPLYHSVDFNYGDEGYGYYQENHPTNWTKDRFDHVIHLRQRALKHARRMWADYLFMVDADVIIVNPNTLQDLMRNREATVVGPLLNCTTSDTFSNFWGDILPTGYYKRSDDYFDIMLRYKKGLFQVPMVHTALLINLNHRISHQLSFDQRPQGYNGPTDDVIVFAFIVASHGLKMYLDNTKFFGYFSMPLDDRYELADEIDNFIHMKMQAFHDFEGKMKLEPSPTLPVYFPKKSKLGFDNVYLINLARRPDRLKKMQYCFDELGIEAELVEAVDGKQLNQTYLDKLGIRQLEGYFDPYRKNGLKYGEIGCFLSHYFIWQDIIKKGFQTVLLFEDDIRFQPAFVQQLNVVMHSAYSSVPNWELLYVGRKRLVTTEQFLESSNFLVWPTYTYWTLSYAINQKGAKKLIDQKPLGKMIAVDEYLPIMFDQHPRKEWKEAFHPRDLVAVSAEPLLVEPTHYTGEANYFSDTENSTLILPGNPANSAIYNIKSTTEL